MRKFRVVHRPEKPSKRHVCKKPGEWRRNRMVAGTIIQCNGCDDGWRLDVNSYSYKNSKQWTRLPNYRHRGN